MKNNFIFISVILSSILLTGCNSNHKEKTPDSIFVTFKDYDDSVLYHTKIPYGTKVSYKGESPKRDTTIDKVYTFVGWDKSTQDNLYENTIFNAQYSEEARKYVVTFYNYDDSELWHTNVEYGTYAVYSFSTPVKMSDDEHFEYVFSGWDKDIASYKIVSDVSFKATFKTNEYVFATFNNYDNSFLKREKVAKGSTAEYSGQTPVKPYDGDDKVYRFAGWDKSLYSLMVDTTFIAQFNLLNLYTVTFKNYNGNILQEVKTAEGDTAVYTGSTPTKPSSQSGDYIYTYTFSGWSASLSNIHGNLTVTAQFTTNVRVTGKTAIIQYLDNYGSGSYHTVSTGAYTNLGYSESSTFYAGCSIYQDGLYFSFAAVFTYGNSTGSGTFIITNSSGHDTFKETMTVKTSSHSFSSLSNAYISYCEYSTTEQNALAIAAISLREAELAINNASSFLSSHDLNYIW